MRYGTWVATAFALALAACGGGGGGGAPAPVTPPTETPAPTPTNSNVSVALSAPADSVPGGATTTMTLTVANAGPAAATDVRISPNLGPGLTLGGVAMCAASGTAVCPSSQDLSAGIASLPAGGTLTFQLAVGVPPGLSGTVTSTPVVTAANDSSLADNLAQAVLRAYSADVSVAASGPAQPVPAGGIATYRMVVTNAGPDTAREVAVSTTLGASQSLGAISCTASGGASCPVSLGAAMLVPSLPRGGSLVFTVPATVASNTTGSIAAVMEATAAGDPVPTNNAASAQGSAFIVAPLATTSITLRSDQGDYIGGGRNYAYTPANAVISGVATGNRFTLNIRGDQNWSANFALPSALAQLAPGTYPNLKRYPFHDPAVGGIDWSGDGRGCNEQLGTITINSVRYDAGQLSAIDLDFEQHCERNPPALRGHVVWVAGDPTPPPAPQTPPPGLWTPSVALPASGTYVYIEGDSGDFISLGRHALYTNANAVLSIGVGGNRASVRVAGDQNWSADFQGMTTLADLQPGYYGNLIRYPFHNPALGGLSWSGEGRGCNTLTGWFVVDGMTYRNGFLATLDLRFEQHCEGTAAALHGKIHWEVDDATRPPGPVNPPPAGLWTPPAAALPASGNYAYLASDPGDFVGLGQSAAYGGINVVLYGARAYVTGGGWTGDFQAMNTLQQLQPGYYGDLERFPFHNAAKGGLDWSGQGRGCNTLKGWFVVDKITYVGTALAAIDIRFEQHCEEGASALRGAIHWAQ